MTSDINEIVTALMNAKEGSLKLDLMLHHFFNPPNPCRVRSYSRDVTEILSEILRLYPNADYEKHRHPGNAQFPDWCYVKLAINPIGKYEKNEVGHFTPALAFCAALLFGMGAIDTESEERKRKFFEQEQAK